MKNYEVIFLKAIMNKKFDVAENALNKLSIIYDADIKRMLFSLGSAGAFFLEGYALALFLDNFRAFSDSFCKEHEND